MLPVQLIRLALSAIGTLGCVGRLLNSDFLLIQPESTDPISCHTLLHAHTRLPPHTSFISLCPNVFPTHPPLSFIVRSALSPPSLCNSSLRLHIHPVTNHTNHRFVDDPSENETMQFSSIVTFLPTRNTSFFSSRPASRHYYLRFSFVTPSDKLHSFRRGQRQNNVQERSTLAKL
jgi:hypothetical protein